MPTADTSRARFDLTRESGGVARVRFGGNWTLAAGLPAPAELQRALAAGGPPRRLVLEPHDLEDWDSALVAFAHSAAELCAGQGAEVDASALPEGARKLLALARAVPAQAPAHAEEDDALLARVGRTAILAWDTGSQALAFLGTTATACVALLFGRARFRRVDFVQALEQAGVAALGIVALINFLVGAVLAFVGAVQLQPFGATIYVANLVAVAVTREVGALMTGIVMAGRTGAAFAATLGTMTVNEEIDALRTMGLRPVHFLVLPRLLATGLMMPALVAYADLLGILGGMFVGVTVLDLGAVEYLLQTRSALPLRHVVIGLVKGCAYGLVVALTGCHYGLRCGRSASDVGKAATSAVVMGIVFVVVVDAVFTVVLHALGL